MPSLPAAAVLNVISIWSVVNGKSYAKKKENKMYLLNKNAPGGNKI